LKTPLTDDLKQGIRIAQFGRFKVEHVVGTPSAIRTGLVLIGYCEDVGDPCADWRFLDQSGAHLQISL